MDAEILVAPDAAQSSRPVVRRGLLVDFSDTGNSAEYKLAGWSVAAPDGTRTLGTQSTLRLPRPATPSDYALVLRAKPFSVGEIVPHHRCRILVNGQNCAAVVIRGRITLEVWVPWSLIADNDHFEVDLELPDAERPSALGETNDRRLLALIVRSIAVRRFNKLVVRQPVSGAKPDRYKDLMMHFVSLGTNCEVGLMQRMCGAEPLGLLRFAATPLDGLISALGTGFAGMGKPEQTVLYGSPSGEYLVRDRRYDIRYHTGVRQSHVAEDVVAVQQQQRLRYLARKMTEELQKGEFIFVFRSDEFVPRVDVMELLAELRRFGNNTLLWVVPETRPGTRGRVSWIDEGLIRGTIDRLAKTDLERDISFEGWIEVCEKAFRLWKKGRPPTPSPPPERDPASTELGPLAVA